MDATQYADIIARITQTIEATPIQPVIVNPQSNFVVATYWWGRGNINKNLQKPCPEDVVDEEELREEVSEMIAEEDPDFLRLREEVEELKRITPRTDDIKKQIKTKVDSIYKTVNTFLKSPNGLRYKADRLTTALEKLKADGKFKQGETYDKMIDTWNEDCKKNNCNYLSAEYVFFQQPGMYQYGINAKPLFIKKALQASQGRGVLYIDGDMRPNKYPAIFDLKNVDYMARGWNMDPRSSSKYESDICIDPYIFETSGGIMYFSDTYWSHKLLDAWVEELAKFESKGKAEDRVISLIVMERDFLRQMNMIQLPIEYLWLTDLYTFQNPRDANKERSLVEHPACLTGEERAQEQAEEKVVSSREPEGYSEKVEDNITCDTKCGIFYEYIFFPKKEMVANFDVYLDYIDCLKYKPSGERVFEDIVQYDDKYGNFNAIAYQNDTKARQTQVSGTGVVSLPQTATIPEILANLYARRDVKVGDIQNVPENCDVFGTITTPPPEHRYYKSVELDTTKPMFFSASNVIVQHLLRMCETTQDINKHVSGSYMFFSRIRWGVETPFNPEEVDVGVPALEPVMVRPPEPTTPALSATPAPAPPPELLTPEPATPPPPELASVPTPDASTILTPSEPLPSRNISAPPSERVPSIPELPEPTEPVVAPLEPVVPTPEPAVAPSEPVVAPPEPVVAPPEPVVARPEPVVPTPEPVVAPPEPLVPTPEPTVAPPESVVAPPELVVEPKSSMPDSSKESALERLRNARGKTIDFSVSHPGMIRGSKRRTYRKRIIKHKRKTGKTKQ
jgi:hypothetical protein